MARHWRSKEDRLREEKHGAAIGKAVKAMAIAWTLAMVAVSMAIIGRMHL